MGLQKQVLRNCIEVGAGTLRGVGAVLVLWLVCPTILGFFIWQIFVTFLHTLLTAVFLWNSLPRTSQSAHFQKELFFRLWRFAVGLTGISIASLIFSQTDKIILSRILTLEMFGYYAFAVAVSKALYLFIDPISSALFPRFSQLASLQNQAELKQLYHKVCQLMSSIVFPPTVVVALFSSEILLLWTGNPLIVANTHIVVSFLIIGSALNGLMYLPFALQLSHGWIKLALYSDIVSIIVFAPLLLFLSIYHGAVGASVAWVILNAGYVLVCIQIMHLRILKGEQWQWYFNDVGIPLLGALGTALVWRVFAPDEMSRYAMLVYLTCVSVTALFASIVVTPYSRFLIGQILINFKVPSKKEIVA